MSGFVPGYCKLLASGELEERVAALEALLTECEVCPCACRVDRRTGLGRCATPTRPVLASWGPHFGEEPPLSGRRGSGTIFLANCNLRCAFCQNHDISQQPKKFMARATSFESLAALMLELQEEGCHNINWVSPTHQAPQLAHALLLAARQGLSIPIVYNTNAYDSRQVLRLLDGVVDVYLPDLKYAAAEVGRELSRVRGYPAAARAAIAEMFRQLGSSWRTASDGTLLRGLFVRILILPHDLAGVEESLRWLAEGLSPRVAVSLMSQYRPSHFAARPGRFPRLARGLTPGEYGAAIAALARWNQSEHSYVQPFVRDY